MDASLFPVAQQILHGQRACTRRQEGEEEEEGTLFLFHLHCRALAAPVQRAGDAADVADDDQGDE